jgi:hypothetical protein
MGKGRDAYKYGKNHLIGSGSDGLGKSATSCQDTYDLISNSIRFAEMGIGNASSRLRPKVL